MPKTLYGHSSLSQGNDLIVLGGRSYSSVGGYQYSSSIFKLTCNNRQFTWIEMEMKLKTARNRFVADFIPHEHFWDFEDLGGQ